MDKTFILNDSQRQLAEQNMKVVSRVICRYISVNDTLFGFEYDDLYQEGCIWLCKAAVTFRPDAGAVFAAYAEKVVANGLRTYCRLMGNSQKRLKTVSLDSLDPASDYLQFSAGLFIYDVFEERIAEEDVLRMLHHLKQEYTGTVRRGIEAIELEVKGYSGTEIAEIYGVRANQIGAWISRAKQKLRENRVFFLWTEDYRGRAAS